MLTSLPHTFNPLLVTDGGQYTVKIKVLFQPGYRSTQLQLSMISSAHSHDTRYIELSSTSRHSISPSNVNHSTREPVA